MKNGATRPKTLREVADRMILGENPVIVLKEWKDEALKMDAYKRADLWADEPALTGDRIMDVYLAGMAEHLSVQTDQTPPNWVNAPSRFLDRPVFWGGRHSRVLLTAETPSAFRRRLLFCGAPRDE